MARQAIQSSQHPFTLKALQIQGRFAFFIGPVSGLLSA
jgi:hypothetical protein